MKIVLVNPFQGPRVSGQGRIHNRAWTPLDLANSAALLRRGGHDVAVIDANAERLGAADAARRRTACFFMIGLPECTPQDIEDIRAFARELAPDYPQFHVATPYPGTGLHDRVKNDPKLRFSDDSLFPEAVEGRFCLEELKRITRRAYLDYYFRPGYIWGRLAQGGWGHLVEQASLLWGFLRAE